MSGLKLSKNQYAHLVRDIERLLKEHMSGGGLYDFSAPETLEYHPLSSLEFWVEDPEMEGGGFFSSIKKAANHVWGALQKSGIIDKGKARLTHHIVTYNEIPIVYLRNTWAVTRYLR